MVIILINLIEQIWKDLKCLIFSNSMCTTDFEINDKQYQNVFLPNATENILILAKKLQEKHTKSKAVTKF